MAYSQMINPFLKKSHAVKNTANQKAGKSWLILQYTTVFNSSLLAT